MKRVPYVAIILENVEGEVLLLLRDNKSHMIYPNHWTLVGGKVELFETPQMAAQRKLEEETGLVANLSLWKRYDRYHPVFVIDQHIFVGKIDSRGMLVLGRDVQFFKPDETKYLNIGYGFDALLNDYFLVHEE
jgi:8-oxo-dGTP diphosphatase